MIIAVDEKNQEIDTIVWFRKRTKLRHKSITIVKFIFKNEKVIPKNCRTIYREDKGKSFEIHFELYSVDNVFYHLTYQPYYTLWKCVAYECE